MSSPLGQTHIVSFQLDVKYAPAAKTGDDGTPSGEALEEIVVGLEGGSSVSFASDMAGIAAIFDQLHTGSVVALSDDSYQAVAGIAKAGQSRGRGTMHRIAVADTARWIETWV